MAVADALDKARHFILGCNDLTIAVDHRPLLKIFGDRSLGISNVRLRNLKEKTPRLRFSMVHVPGVKNRDPDTLSRHLTGDSSLDRLHLMDDISPISHQLHPQCRLPEMPTLLVFQTPLLLAQNVPVFRDPTVLCVPLLR